MARKRVIFHIGFHKTGSSALQGFFSQNVEALALAGVSYPYPEPASVVAAGGCSGNLIQILYREGYMGGFRQGIDKPVSRVTPEYFAVLKAAVERAPNDTVLLSGEMMGVWRKQQIQQLEAFRRDHDIEIVCFVRDPFDFVCSCWRQIVKSTLSRPRLEDYLREQVTTGKLSMLGSFGNFHELGVPLRVLRFEKHRKNVAKAFFDAIDIQPPVEIATEREFNRSLTVSEATLACMVAPYDRGFAATFVRAALNRTAVVDPGFYSRQVHERILELFADNIALINSYLPPGEQLSTTVRNQSDVEPSVRTEDLALYFRLLKERPVPGDLEQALMRLRGLLRIGTSSRLPLGFDPKAYLFHNPDVAAAGVDPERHFLEHGQREDRLYKYH